MITTARTVAIPPREDRGGGDEPALGSVSLVVLAPLDIVSVCPITSDGPPTLMVV